VKLETFYFILFVVLWGCSFCVVCMDYIHNRTYFLAFANKRAISDAAPVRA